MVWYEKKNFDEYFELVSEFEKNSPLRKDSESLPIYTEENVNLYVSHLLKFYEDQFKTSYLKNLISCPGMNRIIMNLEQHRKFASTYVRKRLLARIDDIERRKYTPTHASGAPRFSYLYFITSEFRDYLYVDRLLENEKNKKIKQKISDYLNLHSEINCLLMDAKPSNTLLTRSFSNRSLERIRFEADAIEVEKYRANHREVIFARNVIRQNRSYYQGPRISAVQDLMHLPFFERKLDISTLNRISRKLQGQK